MAEGKLPMGGDKSLVDPLSLRNGSTSGVPKEFVGLAVGKLPVDADKSLVDPLSLHNGSASGVPKEFVEWLEVIERKLDAAIAAQQHVEAPRCSRSTSSSMVAPRKSFSSTFWRYAGSSAALDAAAAADTGAVSARPRGRNTDPSSLRSRAFVAEAEVGPRGAGNSLPDLPGMLEDLEEERRQEPKNRSTTEDADGTVNSPANKLNGSKSSGVGLPATSASRPSNVGVRPEGEFDKVTWTADDGRSGVVGSLASCIGLGSMYDKFWHIREQAEQHRGCGYELVHNTAFQLCISGVIIVHAMLTGYSADVALNMEVFNAPDRPELELVEILFSLFFFLELLARLVTERLLFFIGQEWRWNVFDTLLVAMSLFDMGSGSPDGSAVNSANVARILRLSRFCRLLRISRVMKQFSSLRLIMFALLDSMASLAWCFVFILFTMYVFAVLVVYGVAEYFREGMLGPNDVETSNEMKEWFGGIYPAMVTFYMAITGGADWSDPVRVLKKIHPLYEPLFIFYIFFMCFGVLNVVVGAFVATSNQIAADDREAMIKYETERLGRYTERIKGFFKDADVDKSGTLSWEEFRAHLHDPKVKAYFQSLELDVSQAHVLFELLDADGSNQVTVDEFLDGCLRLKGQARSIDLNMLLFMCRKVFASILESLPLQDGPRAMDEC